MLEFLLCIVNIEDALQFRGKKKSHRSRNKSQLISFWLNLQKNSAIVQKLGSSLDIEGMCIYPIKNCT